MSHDMVLVIVNKHSYHTTPSRNTFLRIRFSKTTHVHNFLYLSQIRQDNFRPFPPSSCLCPAASAVPSVPSIFPPLFPLSSLSASTTDVPLAPGFIRSHKVVASAERPTASPPALAKVHVTDRITVRLFTSPFY